MREDVGRDVRTEEDFHSAFFVRLRRGGNISSSDFRTCCSVGCLRSSGKAGSNESRASKKSFQGFSFVSPLGISTTEFPSRFTYTSSPSKRNSFGRRTAWLRPFLKSLAVCMAVTDWDMPFGTYRRRPSLKPPAFSCWQPSSHLTKRGRLQPFLKSLAVCRGASYWYISFDIYRRPPSLKPTLCLAKRC